MGKDPDLWVPDPALHLLSAYHLPLITRSRRFSLPRISQPSALYPSFLRPLQQSATNSGLKQCEFILAPCGRQRSKIGRAGLKSGCQRSPFFSEAPGENPFPFPLPTSRSCLCSLAHGPFKASSVASPSLSPSPPLLPSSPRLLCLRPSCLPLVRTPGTTVGPLS